MRFLHLAFTPLMVLLFYYEYAYASRCSGDQIQRMINAGFTKQEITQLCEAKTDSPSQGMLSREEVRKKVGDFVTDVTNPTYPFFFSNYWFELPNKQNTNRGHIEKYYQVLKEAGYISGWEMSNNKLVLKLTEKGEQFLRSDVYQTNNNNKRELMWSVLCCDFKSGLRVTGITPDPRGGSARGEFTVAGSEPLRKISQLLGGDFEKVFQVMHGAAIFRLYDDGWRVESVDLNIKGPPGWP